MMGYDMSAMWGWGAAMMILMPLAWIALIGAGVWLIARLIQPPQAPRTLTHERSAVRILEDRLARGEIDIEEFRARRAALAE